MLVLSLTLAPMPVSSLMLFLVGALLLIVGVGLFNIGVDMAMMPIGEGIGAQVSSGGRLWTTLPLCFLIGAFVTIAEPDLQVLARQVPAVPDMVIILTVAVGVGIFLMVAFLRAKFGWELNRLLIIFYLVVFVLAFQVPDAFLPVAFDSGGVTTGPITVPFIMAMGAGLAALRRGSGGEADSFGVVALCSIGPILAVMLLGLFYQTSDLSYTPFSIPDLETTADLGQYFASGFPTYIEEVALGLLPIVVFFAVFQIAALRFNRRRLLKIIVGILYTYVGLVLFLTGVNVGFMPAVHVLNQQVEELTGGAVSQRAMGLSLSLGVAAAVGLAMLRVLTGLSILWLLIPGYAVALGLSFRVPKIFTAIAFDSGGVASGPMTATFLLPFAMGACQAVGGDVLTDAFGIVAMVAMTPLIAIQVLGLVYQRQAKSLAPAETVAEAAIPSAVYDIIIYDDPDGSGAA